MECSGHSRKLILLLLFRVFQEMRRRRNDVTVELRKVGGLALLHGIFCCIAKIASYCLACFAAEVCWSYFARLGGLQTIMARIFFFKNLNFSLWLGVMGGEY